MACSFAAMSDSRARISAAIAATICARLGPAGVSNRSLSLSATLSFNAATTSFRSAAYASFEAHATTGGMRPVPKGARNSPPADGTWATGPQRFPCSADTAASTVATLHTISTPPRFPHRGVGPARAPDLLGKAAPGHSGNLHCRRAARRAHQVRGPRPHSLRSSHRLHGYDRQRPLVVAPRPPLTRGLPAINPVHRHI